MSKLRAMHLEHIFEIKLEIKWIAVLSRMKFLRCIKSKFK